ncbi:geranylgeranylglycerol-phosphate geranylgeranyltransferase [Fulvivirga sedimenti]|uniref:Geranylgeranylglycerol-phosphate geranylgeranyltransferase n=1 Tax=Fulvivirga sedimenti TaxID=2879465 RepID=A0A9X1HLS3_9BACT|nr:geranylgeranylglycerol-phosphate geranylgeranyltransferase [Fulvivirga sedimenti]MCA6074226.1 geranylgeranylglycerol-phosphate geranylgeranyltransferase [Fulvivirga sedimenti]
MEVPAPSTPYHYTFTGLLRITRVWNLVILVLAQYFTAIFLASGDIPWIDVLLNPKMFFLSLSTALIAAAGYVINDYYDVKIDLINKPQRVVVGKFMKRRVAMFFHVFFSIVGVLLGFLVSWKLALINLLSAGLLWLYSNQLKRLPVIGNLSVAVLTGISIYIVHFIYGSSHALVLAYSLFAFCFTMIREIIKDMEDLKGDATFGCRTLPVVVGLRKTKWFIYILSVSFVLGLVALSFVFVGQELSLFSAGLLLPIFWLLFNLSKADTMDEYRRLSNHCKIIMLAGILSMILF